MFLQRNFPEFVLEEFRLSSIPNRLTKANVEWLEGEEAVVVLAQEAMVQAQKVNSYVTTAAARWRKKYQFAAAGGWATTGCNLDGTPAHIYYFKPKEPRKRSQGFGGNTQKTKVIKYETPALCPAPPILPWVDAQTAQAIYRRYNLKPLPGEFFWQTIQRSNVEIAITEGFKKALSLLAQGIPAIAIRGITQWRTPKTDDLHPIIAQLATAGRRVYIVFDQDEKAKTQAAVRKQAIKLGHALVGCQCKPLYLVWDTVLGKGIDDVIYKQGANAATWLVEALCQSWNVETYQREARIFTGLSTIKQLSQTTFQIERVTEGPYLPELPPLAQGAIHVVKAPMNSGKTTRLGENWVQNAREQNWLTLVLAPLNSLGKQTAQKWNLPHIHDFSKSPEQQQALLATISYQGGVVLCPDSLHCIPPWFLDKPVLLILDEANQVVNHIVEGNTLKSRWSEIVEKFGTIAKHAAEKGAIVLSEDGLPDRAIDFVKKVSEAKAVRVFQHFKHGSTWQCSAMTGQVSGFRKTLLERLEAAKQDKDRQPLLFVSTSQQECRRLERVLSNTQPELKVFRIDSQTNEKGTFNSFFIDPDQWIHDYQPDVLILSPSVKSGVSIEGNVALENAYFKSVWGYFPSLDTDSQMQLLGRYRPPVPRFLFAPPFIRTNGEESLYRPKAIIHQIQQNAAALADAYGFALLLDPDGDSQDTHQRTIEAATLEYLATSRAISGNQKQIAYHALINRLEEAGHKVKREKVDADKETSQLFNSVIEELWREDAAEGAAVVVDPDIHTVEWAISLTHSLDVSREDRVIASKVLLRQEFPGIDFNDCLEWYEGIYKNYGAMRRGVVLQAKAENLLGAKEEDRAGVSKIFGANIRAFHRLPYKFVQAALIEKTGVLALLDGKPYSNADPRAIKIKAAALWFANQINYWLRLTIKPEQTPVEICNKLLKKLNISVEQGQIEVSRPGRRGEQLARVYKITLDSNCVRSRLLEAARRKVAGAVSAICNNKDSPNIKNTDTSSNPPPDVGKGVSDGGYFGIEEAQACQKIPIAHSF